ncbi:MAG: hypothetical protein FWE82_10685, partial [Defluviitaleaceae bacterium]|nr:hypothetical protein [Defluviitaleaceae bacterium]
MSGIHDEEKYFSDVSETILKKINILAAGLVKIKNRVAETRDEMWVETHIVRNFDDAAHLSTLLNAVSLEERQYISESKQLSQLKRMLETPYFGRVDFIENGNEKAETIYVGINSLSDDNDRFFFVYDWRAPISSLFYDYGIGESSFAAPDGIIKGETILKRQYKTEKGKLIFYCDTDLTIGDEILKYELSKTSDAKIKVIINTIQQEQNRIIRSDADNLLVFGPAGSGKTSVGRHRLAYLLYKNRSGLNSAGIRIFSSSYIFSTYISGVIPELGEEDVQTLDFLDLFDKHLKKRAHDMFFQIESLIENDDPSHSMYIKIKHSKDFVDFTEQYIKSFFPNEIGDAIFFEKIICDKNKIMSLYADRTSKSTLQSKTGRVTDYLSECYDEFFAAETQLIHDTFNDHYDEKFNKQEIKEHFEIYKALSVNQYKNLLSPDAVVLYNRIVRAYAVKNNLPQKFTKFTESSLEQEILFYEDALMLLYIEILIGKIKAEPAVRHILIDEAQDM